MPFLLDHEVISDDANSSLYHSFCDGIGNDSSECNAAINRAHEGSSSASGVRVLLNGTLDDSEQSCDNSKPSSAVNGLRSTTPSTEAVVSNSAGARPKTAPPLPPRPLNRNGSASSRHNARSSADTRNGASGTVVACDSTANTSAEVSQVCLSLLHKDLFWKSYEC